MTNNNICFVYLVCFMYLILSTYVDRKDSQKKKRDTVGFLAMSCQVTEFHRYYRTNCRKYLCFFKLVQKYKNLTCHSTVVLKVLLCQKASSQSDSGVCVWLSGGIINGINWTYADFFFPSAVNILKQVLCLRFFNIIWFK